MIVWRHVLIKGFFVCITPNLKWIQSASPVNQLIGPEFGGQLTNYITASMVVIVQIAKSKISWETVATTELDIWLDNHFQIASSVSIA